MHRARWTPLARLLVVLAASGGATAAPQASPYVWPNGPPPDPEYFPLAVWLQDPANAAAYREIGINLFIALWEGPREDQLDALTVAGMPVLADQNDVGLAHLDDPIVQGWMQQDEPDNAQPDGAGGWGPCIAPAEVVRRYERMRQADPSRPVFLNLGQGVAWDLDHPYYGRGSACAGRWEQYPEYVQGGDIVAFDIYPVTSPDEETRDKLWLVARGVDRLREWTGGRKIVWNVVETTHINSDVRPTPHQVRAEVWMSLVHGSMGIVYFAHEWQPRFLEAGLLEYPDIRAAVTAINAEIRALAPVLNSPTAAGAVEVASAVEAVPVDVMAKRHDGGTYVFAVAMRDGPTEATFTLPDLGAGEVEVLGEDRRVPLVAGAFRDDFEGYGVHLYRVRGDEAEPTLYLPFAAHDGPQRFGASDGLWYPSAR